MRAFCSGFNLYGQFMKHSNLIVDGFIDWSLDGVTGIELSHTYNVFKDNDSFFVGAKARQMEKIHMPEHLNITDISCTDNRILFLSNDGLLFKLDLNKDRKLIPTQLPSMIVDENNTQRDALRKISCGSKINIALSQEGKLFNVPNKLEFENNNIESICTGREHCLLLDMHGNIYSFGSGSRGQLGHGDLEDELEPKLVEALAGVKISKIAAGGWNSCALSEDGTLYTWGWNGNGQLGLGNTNESIMATPHVIDFEDIHDKRDCININVIDVACGNRHTVVLLDNGHLFGAGWNKYSQLGRRDVNKDNLYTMTFIRDFSNVNVTNLKCGPWSTVVIIN